MPHRSLVAALAAAVLLAPPVLAQSALPAANADWRDLPISAGTWSYRSEPGGSIALFGPAGGAAQFTIRCDRNARVVYLVRTGAPATTGQAPPELAVRTSSIAAIYPAAPATAAPAAIVAAVNPRSPGLDAMGFSRGRFVIQMIGLPTLVAPASAEVLRVVEDCRS